MNDLGDRINERLAAVGISASAASQKAGLGKDFIRDILRGQKVSISTKAAIALAPILECTVEWLVSGSGSELAPEHGEPQSGIRYGGIVEAGAFRRVNDLDQDASYRIIPLAPDPRYPATAQYAFEVIGDSMNLAHIEPGMWVQAVDIHAWEAIHGQPDDGRLVIVARTRNGDPERELTVKRLRIFRDRIELRPESSNKRHEPLSFPNPPVDDDTHEAAVIAVVLTATWIFS